MFEGQSVDRQRLEEGACRTSLLSDIQKYQDALPSAVLLSKHSAPAEPAYLDFNKPVAKEEIAEKIKLTEISELPPLEGKVSDITGRGITDKFAVTSTDLGVSIVAPNGKLISIFGDTFAGDKVGQGDWRSPVALIGTGDANHKIQFDSAAGGEAKYAKQLIDYIHDDPSTGWSRGGISTIIPDDILRIGDKMYFHGIVNQGFGNVIWTGIWSSDDNGESWKMIEKFPGGMDNGFSQCWSWDYDPDDGYVYIVSTGFQRDKGIVLHRVRPEDIGNKDKYSGWGFANGKWSWDQKPTPITPPGEKWGELSLRRLGPGKWLLGGFLASQYALGYRTIDSPTTNLHTTPLQLPVLGVPWDKEDHAHNRVAQLYGGFILPGSQLDKPGGVGLVVSQWNTAQGQPYKSMQFKVSLENTIGKVTTDPRNSNQEDRSALYDNDEYVRSRIERERLNSNSHLYSTQILQQAAHTS